MQTLNAARCERTDLPAYSCSHCRGLGWDAPALDPELDPFSTPGHGGALAHPSAVLFTATLPGSCSDCGGDIIPGDTIRSAIGGGYSCSACVTKDARA